MIVKTVQETRLYRNALALLATLLLAGCGVSNVVIEGSFPTPNIAKLPLTVAVYYDTALREFAYIEYSETGQEEYNIASGASHIQLFNAVLPAMFDQVVESQDVAELAVALEQLPNADWSWINVNLGVQLDMAPLVAGGNSTADDAWDAPIIWEKCLQPWKPWIS